MVFDASYALQVFIREKKMNPLIIKYIDKTISSEEKDKLDELIGKDSALREEFAAVHNVYALSAFSSSENDENEGKSQLKKFKKIRRKNNLQILFKHSLRYTAIITVTFLMTWLFLDKREEKQVLVKYEEFKTPPGQRAMLKLHDGTTVWLNASSSLRYPNVFTGNTRNVELDGEAFFDVTSDEKMPFVVSTEKLDIKVLGTKFNVFAYKGKNEFNSFLEEGLIKIYNAANEDKALLLNPNEIAELKGNTLLKRPMNGKNLLLWKEGIYAFDDIPFNEIIEKLQLYYDITIEIDNELLANYRFSGKFRQRDGIVSALRTFQKAYKFSFHKDDELNHVLIR